MIKRIKKQSRTCIAIIKNRRGKLIMAGDRRVSCDWSFSYSCPQPKVRRKDSGILIGASGDSGLCKLIVDIFNPPEVITNDLDTYMYYHLQPALFKLLSQQKGLVDEKKQLNLPPDTQCSVLLGIYGKAYTIDIVNQSTEGLNNHGGVIIIDDAPLPYAIGCGSSTAFPILETESKLHGYNTKIQLELAMQTAGNISPGCNSEYDIIEE